VLDGGAGSTRLGALTTCGSRSRALHATIGGGRRGLLEAAGSLTADTKRITRGGRGAGGGGTREDGLKTERRAARLLNLATAPSEKKPPIGFQ